MGISFKSFAHRFSKPRLSAGIHQQGSHAKPFNGQINNLSDLNQAERKIMLQSAKMTRTPEAQALKQKSLDFLRTHQDEIVNNTHKNGIGRN